MLKTIVDYVVLPAELTDFERSYLKRINRIALWFFVAHLPLFVAVAYFNDTQPLLALALTLVALAGPALAQKTFAEPRLVSLVHGFTAMIMGGLLVHFGQGPVQIEMHFYFFALIAMLALFGNPLVIVTAAVTVMLHHLILWLVLPASVFNYDAPLWVVGVHAAFVVVESVAACFMARSFFDNVIGLEKIVRARTQALDERSGDMRLVLDNVAQGFITLDRDGVMSRERSAIVATWLGAAPASGRFADYLETKSPSSAMSFRLGWEQLTDGFLPIELTLDQMVSAVEIEGRHLKLQYQPIAGPGHDDFDKMLVVVSDVSSEVQNAKLEATQREVMGILERVMRDKRGFLEFFEEASELIDTVTSADRKSITTLKRMLHTLKGNAMIFGVDTIGALCHRIEDRMLESGELPAARELNLLSARWEELRCELKTLLGSGEAHRIQIDDAELEHVLRALLHGAERETLARRIANWRLEPTKQRLTRIGEQAKRIADRLNKGDIVLEVDDNDLRLAPERWASFWASFVHVVRNAIDHGLETGAERAASGKDARGVLRLSTRLEDDTFVIELADDGRGIDWEAIAARAEAAGLEVTDRDSLDAALFADGVSTAAEVSEYSGRGVGMAAIRDACHERGGEIRVHSSPGEGTRLEFRFPQHTMAEDRVAHYLAA